MSLRRTLDHPKYFPPREWPGPAQGVTRHDGEVLRPLHFFWAYQQETPPYPTKAVASSSSKFKHSDCPKYLFLQRYDTFILYTAIFHSTCTLPRSFFSFHNIRIVPYLYKDTHFVAIFHPTPPHLVVLYTSQVLLSLPLQCPNHSIAPKI